MSLLPEVERELMRAARRPLPESGDETADGAADHARSRDHGRGGDHGRGRRGPGHGRGWSGAVIGGLSLAVALAVAAVFVVSLHSASRNGSAGEGTQPSRLTVPRATLPGWPFPGAPHSQRDGDGVATWYCPLAPANRYLPARSGCISVRRVDLSGDGRPDLVILYSRLGRRHANWRGVAHSWRSMVDATRAMLEVVEPDGTRVRARISGAHATSLLGVTTGEGGARELLLTTSEISSGSTAVAYGLRDGHLVAAGATLGYGGDSGAKAGFDCVRRPRPEVIQRFFELMGAFPRYPWQETVTVYAWRDAHLVVVAHHRRTRHGVVPADETTVGAGCTGTR